MNIIHLCYAWYGVVNPITMAATARIYNVYVAMEGEAPTI